MNISDWGASFLLLYLTLLIFVWEIMMGSLALTFLHGVTGGRWGDGINGELRAGGSRFPLLFILFLPILFFLQVIYPWARIENAPILLGHKAQYLSKPFFLGRTLFYFAIWHALTRYSKRSNRITTSRGRDALALILVCLTVSFASIDWLMSLQPEWYSTMFPVTILIASTLSALAFALLKSNFHKERIVPEQREVLRQLGRLLLAFVMLWAYVSFSQFLIIWSADLPEEIGWYLARLNGGWIWLSIILVVGAFFVPFILLLPRHTKENPSSIKLIAFIILITQFLYTAWVILPKEIS